MNASDIRKSLEHFGSLGAKIKKFPREQYNVLLSIIKKLEILENTPSGVEEAPSDDKVYGRLNENWTEIIHDGSGIPDAPIDGETYVRKNAAWTDLDVEIAANAAVSANTLKVSNVTTDLSVSNKTATTLDVVSSDGTDATIPSATITEAGLMAAADKVKLDGITDTDDQSASEVPYSNATSGLTATNVQTAIDEIEGRVDANDAKVSNVTTDLSEGTSTTTTVDVNSSDGTNATLQPASTSRAGVMTKAMFDSLASAEQTSNKGAINGYASLDGSGKVPAGQLPSYVDDVLEYADLASLPVTGEAGKIYVTLDTNKIYRWTGSTYVEVSPDAGAPVSSVNTQTGAVVLDADDISDAATTNKWNITTNLSEGTSTTTTVDVNSSDGTNATLQPASTSRAGVATKQMFDDIQANNAKVSNVTTDLSEGTATTTTVDVNSSDGTNATLQSASTLRAGLLSKAKFDEITANTAKVSNVTTNLSEGTATLTTVNVNSSDGTDATLQAASTLRAGLMTKVMYDEHVINNAKISAPALNVLGIANSSGVYTYYSSYSAALAAAVSGDTIEQFGDITTTTNVTLVDGVNIEGHGHKITNSNTGGGSMFTVPSTFNGSIRNLVMVKSVNGRVIGGAIDPTGSLDLTGSTLITTSGVSNALSITGTNVFTVSNAVVKANTSSSVFTLNTAAGSRIINCRVIQTGTSAFASISTIDADIEHCYGETPNSGYGIQVQGIGRIVYSTGVSVSGVGIIAGLGAVVNSMGISISGIGFEASTGGEHTGIRAFSTSGSALRIFAGASVSNSYLECGSNVVINNPSGGKIRNSVLRTKNNIATGYVIAHNGIGGTFIEELTNCTLVAANASAPYLYRAGVAHAFEFSNNTFEGGTAWNPNITNSIVATADAQGNILT